MMIASNGALHINIPQIDDLVRDALVKWSTPEKAPMWIEMGPGTWTAFLEQQHRGECRNVQALSSDDGRSSLVVEGFRVVANLIDVPEGRARLVFGYGETAICEGFPWVDV